MDTNQIARMIEWLDEERRRDKNTIAKLEERLTQQQEYIETLTRRVNGVESDSSTLRTMFLPVGRDNDIVQTLRSEMQQLVEAVEAKRLTSERDLERRTDVARENIVRPIRELAERLDKLERLLDEIGTARVERDRFANALAALQQRVEDMTKK